MSFSVQSFADFLERFAPTSLAEDWDNVGLLLGDPPTRVERAMTCLTVTPASADEAIAERADLIVAHHPLPFHPLRRIVTDTSEGRILWNLARAGIAIYSPHTGFDSAHEGINQRLAERLGLEAIAPLKPTASEPSIGAGRWGRLPVAQPLAEVAARLKALLGVPWVQAVGGDERPIGTVGVACGSAGEFLDAARAKGCDAFVTGETRFHTCLEAEATNIAMLLTGHYASERFAVELLADVLGRQFPGVSVWASRQEADPLRWL